jgi:hypothetical protein
MLSVGHTEKKVSCSKSSNFSFLSNLPPSHPISRQAIQSPAKPLASVATLARMAQQPHGFPSSCYRPISFQDEQLVFTKKKKVGQTTKKCDLQDGSMLTLFFPRMVMKGKQTASNNKGFGYTLVKHTSRFAAEESEFRRRLAIPELQIFV